MNNRRFARLSHAGLILALPLCLLNMAGCVGATRLPARSRGPSGNKIEPKQIDLGFVQPGTTKRQEVLDKLSSINTGFSSPRLFWGRWVDSNWGYWWMVGVPQGGAAGDAKRVWHVKNIVMSFDENGVVQDKKEFQGDSALWRELHRQLPNLAPLDFAELTSFNLGRSGDSRLTLDKDFMEVHRPKKSPAHIPPMKVLRVSNEGTPDNRDEPGLTCHTLHFSEKTDVGKKLHFCAGGPQVIALFQYLHQTGPKDMQWE